MGGVVNRDLERLVDVYWDLELERSPTGGLFIGDYRLPIAWRTCRVKPRTTS